MSILLDTNVVLWAAVGDRRLKAEAKEILQSTEEVIFISAVTACEIAIKWSQGKIRLPNKPTDFLSTMAKDAGYSQLAITIDHAAGLAELPFHHRDPWDRLLISQARAMGFRIVTSDRIFRHYDVNVIMS